MGPLISITITCYNYGKFMNRSLNAIKKQKFKDYEVILVDDMSQDNTVEIVEAFIRQNPEMNIKLIKNTTNLGVLKSRNIALENSSGKYIMFCDSDDWMDENCLEILAQAALKNDADRVIAQFRDVDQNGKVLQVQKLPKHPSKWICGCHHGTLYKREIFLKYNIKFKNLYPDDVYINVMFHLHCKRVVFVHKTIYNWYVHTDSTSRTLNEESPWIGYKMFEQAASYIMPTIQIIGSDVEKQELELQLIKIYCLAIYHSYRNSSYKELISGYAKINAIMKKYDKNYKKNKFLSIFSESPMRKYATVIVRTTVILEKLHLMRVALLGYHILCKFYYFNL